MRKQAELGMTGWAGECGRSAAQRKRGQVKADEKTEHDCKKATQVV